MIGAQRRPAPGVAGFLPILLVFSAVAAISAARLPAPAGEVLWNLDLPKIDVPLAVFFHEALEQGRLPLWEDRLGLGFPLYAEGQVGAFYPPNWLIFRLEPLTALDVSRVVHLIVAGVGSGLLALRISGSRTGSVVAVAVVVLGGAIVSKLQWTNLVAAYAWLPWVLLPLAGRSAPTRLELLAAGSIWGAQALTGHPNMWLLTGLAAGVLLATKGRDLRSAGRVIAFGLLGGAVGSIQLLPTLMLTGLSARSAGLSADDVFTSSATVFDPLAFGFARPFIRGSPDGWDIFTAWYPDGIFALYESTAFVGLVVLGLAAIGATTRRARPWLVVGAVALAIPLIASARPDPWLQVPILNGLRSPVRAYLVVAFILGLLASIGIGRLGRVSPGAGVRRAVALGGPFAAAYIVALVTAAWAPAAFETAIAASSSRPSPDASALARERALVALTEPVPVLVELGIAVVAVALLLALRDGLPARPARLAVGILAIAPLALFSPDANPFRPLEEAWPRNGELASTLRGMAPNRVLTIGEPGFYEGAPDRLAAAGIRDLSMFSSLNLRATDELVAAARDDDLDAELLRRLVGVDTLVTFGDRPCPGESLVDLQSHDATICRVPALIGAYWLPAAVLATGPDGPTVDLVAANEGARPAAAVEDGPGSLTVAVDGPAPGYLWVDRAWWPGWSVSVDGRGVTPERAMAGMAVPLDTGRHTVELRLLPWEVFAGVASALVALAVGLALALSPWVRRRRSLRASSPHGP